MANNNRRTIEYDVEGYDVITEALMELLNQYPALQTNDAITFNTLDENSGISMFPLSGSIIERKSKDIIGHTTEICQYPFYVIARYGYLNESRKINMKEWLDKLGRWLEQQPIIVGETTYTLSNYPVLSGNRRFLEIRRTTPAALNAINSNNTEDWAISIVARYENQY